MHICETDNPQVVDDGGCEIPKPIPNFKYALKFGEGWVILSHTSMVIWLLTHVWIKGLRPVLEGFVVPMHEGACETGSQIPRA